MSIENLLSAWQELLRGKRGKKDVQEFQLRLMDNILALHIDLRNGTYRHGPYHQFNISDPKPRLIHKATVRDRLVHRAVYRKLYPFFDKIFIADSFSCRNNKGTHRAMRRFRDLAYIVSKNHIHTCWVLKCDVRKFFASISQDILMNILDSRIKDKQIVDLLKEIISSFNSGKPGVGLPLGNLTSQLFCNIYMNKFDQFVKHGLKIKYYIRYADDFVFLSRNQGELEGLIPLIENFLGEKLHLRLHPDKVFIKTIASGVDFLGWVHFADHRVLRAVTKRRMFKKIRGDISPQGLQSYFGMMSHGNTEKIKKRVIHLTQLLQKH